MRPAATAQPAQPGRGRMGETEAEQQEAMTAWMKMTAWMNWFGSLGGDVADAGAPFGPCGSIASDGTLGEIGGSPLTGYSIITADGVSDASAKAKACPALSAGGSLEIYEATPMG